jgi:hypothetical protein
MLGIPHCLDNRLIDGGKVVSPTHRPHFTAQKDNFFNVSGIHFYSRLSKPEGLGTSKISVVETIGYKLEGRKFKTR